MRFDMHIKRISVFAFLFLALALIFGANSTQDHSPSSQAGLLGLNGPSKLFAATTVFSVQSGQWSNPSTWSNGKVPTTGDSITINRGHVVTYDTFSNDVLGEVDISGTLIFSRSTDTRLRLGGNLLVRSGGHLDIGTANDLAIETIRSVAKGVLGVAVIQALLSAIGLVAIGVPAPGIWAGIILLLAIMQLPPLLILGPIAVWVFSVADATPATIFAIYAFIVSISDSFLKPMFLGRGMDIPMLVILIGAIGGAFTSGIVGLFIGAVVLAVGYKLLIAWMVNEEDEEQEAPADTTA